MNTKKPMTIPRGTTKYSNLEYGIDLNHEIQTLHGELVKCKDVIRKQQKDIKSLEVTMLFCIALIVGVGILVFACL